MVAGSVEQRPPGVVRQVAEQKDVVLERREWSQRLRQIGERPLVRRVPVPHVDAVRHVDERHPDRRLAALRARECRGHGVEERQRDGGAESAEERAPWQRLACDEHQRAPVASSPRLDWNGRLFTI